MHLRSASAKGLKPLSGKQELHLRVNAALGPVLVSGGGRGTGQPVA